MPKKFIKKYLPHPDKIKNHKHLRFFGDLIHDPNLWHLNRRSVPGAFAIGLFWAFVPIPFQMVPAAAFAIFFRKNLPISLVLVWISNPVTYIPIFYACYKFGAWMMGVEALPYPEEMSWEWLKEQAGIIWLPLCVGWFTVASGFALIGYFGLQGLWRLNVARAWSRRKEKRKRKSDRSKN
jgi:uncharacterized protein (DUF2062 family)